MISVLRVLIALSVNSYSFLYHADIFVLALGVSSVNWVRYGMYIYIYIEREREREREN